MLISTFSNDPSNIRKSRRRFLIAVISVVFAVISLLAEIYLYSCTTDDVIVSEYHSDNEADSSSGLHYSTTIRSLDEVPAQQNETP